MNPTFHPMSGEHYRAVTGRDLPAPIARGFAMWLDGQEPQMIVGVVDDGDRHRLVSAFSPAFRAKLATFEGKRALLMAAERAVNMVAPIPGPVDAVAAADVPESAAFLERMNFRCIDGRVHRFAGLTLREKVQIAEREMLERGAPVEIPVRHYFSEGLYAREIRIPAGTILTGKIHKRTNLNILSEGEISVLTESGVQRLRAPFTVVSPAGTKRIAYAHTDCVWTTIHGTPERDLDKIEALFIAQSEPEWIAYCRALELKEAA